MIHEIINSFKYCHLGFGAPLQYEDGIKVLNIMLSTIHSYLQASVKLLLCEVEMPEEQAHCEEGPAEERCGFCKTWISWILFMNFLERVEMPEILFEAVSDESEVLGDIINHRPETRETSRYNRFVMKKNELDTCLL